MGWPADFNAVTEDRYKVGWWREPFVEFEPKNELEREQKFRRDHDDIMRGLKSVSREGFQGVSGFETDIEDDLGD